MDAFHRQRSAGSDRFLGLFYPPPPSEPSFPPSSAPAAGVELHEADVLWTSSADGSETTPRSPASATSSCGSAISPSDRLAALRRPHDWNFGILAALAEDGAGDAVSPPLVQRKPSVASTSSLVLNSPPRSPSTATAAARMIPVIPKSKLELPFPMPIGRIYQAQSLPVNVPVVPRRARMFEGDAAEGPDNGDGQEMMPPHEIVARNYGSESPMKTFSMLEGAGRTLKGRDLRRVRDAVFRQTGFQD